MELTPTEQVIDMRPVLAAGEPGTAGRVLIFSAMSMLSKSPTYEHLGRGPTGYDWLGFIREAISQARQAIGLDPNISDLSGYGLCWHSGALVPAAEAVLRSWGLVPVDLRDAQPGDILVFGMPRAHAAILLPRTAYHTPPELAHAYWGQSPTRTHYTTYWRSRVISAFRLES